MASDGSLCLAVDAHVDIWVDGRSAELVERLTDHLAGLRPDVAIGFDLRVVLLRDVAAVLSDAKADRSWDALCQRAAGWTRMAVVSVALGGVYSSALTPIAIGSHAVVGHLSGATEDVIAQFARSYGLHGFRFTDAAWWTEEFLHAEADGDYAAELAEVESLDETWQPLMLAVAVPSVGTIATWRAIDIAEAVAGILATMVRSGSDWLRPKPWVLGQATLNASQREPKFDENGLPSCIPLQVDTLPTHELHSYSTVDMGEFAYNVDIAVALEDPVIRELISSVCEDRVDRKLVDACRLINAASLLPADLGAHLLAEAASLLSGLAPAIGDVDVPQVEASLSAGKSHNWARREDLRSLLGACAGAHR
jgi:hypothetical protein